MSRQSTLTQDAREAGGERLCPYLYRVLDAEAPLSPSARFALWQVEEVLLGRADAASASRAGASDLRVLKVGVADRWMSSQHAKLSLVMQKWVLEDTKSKNGVRINGAPVQRAELTDGDVIELGRTFFLYRAAQPFPEGTPLELDASQGATAALGLSTLSPRLSESFDRLSHVAKSSVTVALHGPTGTGKEVLARAVHVLSGRRGHFVAVNCGALPATLVESVIFGHRKGAFSGAIEDRVGYVRAAHGGTLFLDEVGDLPLEAQPALLRVLQERVVTPVGDTSAVPVDVRLVSATHRDLAALARAHGFRDDLRGRLNGFEVELPSLAERKEDLGLFVAALLQRVAPDRAATLQLSLEAARALFAYSWPLNVRELEKALEAAVALAGTQSLELRHFPSALRAPPALATPAAEDPGDAALRERLAAALAAHGGNVSAVARELGKARMQVQRWMARFGFEGRDFKK